MSLSIVSPGDFTYEVNVPNRTDFVVIEKLQYYINTYEPKLLSKLLGDTLYADFKAGLEGNPTLGKWLTLHDLVIPSILRYVYYYFRKNEVTQFNGVGETVASTENSFVVSPIQKMVDRWNEMVDNNYKVVRLIRETPVDYGESYGCARDIFTKINTFSI